VFPLSTPTYTYKSPPRINTNSPIFSSDGGGDIPLKSSNEFPSKFANILKPLPEEPVGPRTPVGPYSPVEPVEPCIPIPLGPIGPISPGGPVAPTA